MGKNYTSDLSDSNWKQLQKKLSEKLLERKRKWDLGQVFNAIFYVLKNGCVWRDLPKDFPPYPVVFYYFNRWKKEGIIELIHENLYATVRIKSGRNSQASLGCIDSQSVKCTSINSRATTGYDGGKKIKGRKRHIIVDTLGLLMTVIVHPANVQDRDGARLLLSRMLENRWAFGRLKTILTDGAYNGKLLDWFKATFQQLKWKLRMVKRTEEKGFHVIAKRWIVERTFAWFGNYRRLSKDYERLTDTAEAFIQLAMIRIMLNKL